MNTKLLNSVLDEMIEEDEAKLAKIEKPQNFSEAYIYPILQKTSVSELLKCLDEDKYKNASCKLPYGMYITDDYTELELSNETDGTHYRNVMERILSDSDTKFIWQDEESTLYESTWEHKGISFVTWRAADVEDDSRNEQFSHIIIKREG